jgi:hypothetical protein
VLKIEFKVPEHGWLPVIILYQDIEEYFDTSDVPRDPISQLMEALDSAITGGGGEVWWHLESGGYYLNLHAEHGKLRVKLEFSMNSIKPTREIIFEFTGSFEETVVPIRRSLRKLQSYNWSEFTVPDKAMNSITAQVKLKQKG